MTRDNTICHTRAGPCEFALVGGSGGLAWWGGPTDNGVVPNPIRTSAIAVLALLGAASPAAAQTLEEALSAAYENNPYIQASRETLKATDEQLAQAYQYWWRPTLDLILSGEYDHIDSSTHRQTLPGGETITDFDEYAFKKSVELQSELYLYRGGQTQAAIDNAQATIEAQEAVLAVTEMTVLQDVSESYADVVLEIVSLELADQQIDDMRELHAMIDDMLASQRATVGDLAQINLSIAETEDSRLSTQAELQTARNQFRELTGILPTTLQRWPALPAPPANLAEALDTARTRNPNVLAAQAEVAANEAAVREDAGLLLPTISITGSYTLDIDQERYIHSGSLTEHDRENTASVILQVTVPFYDGGASYSLVREAKREVSESRAQLRVQLASVEDDVTTAWQTYNLSERRINTGMERWAAASEALAAEFQLFDQGDSTIRDLINAHTDVIEAQLAVEEAQHDAFVAHVDLLTAMGVFDARNLDLPVTLFDARAYLREINDLPFGIGLD